MTWEDGSSLWGGVQTVRTIVPGIREVSTASHGGLVLSDELNARIPAPLRRADGAYEEDCEWAVVVASFPELAETFARAWDRHRLEPGPATTAADLLASARQVLKDFRPDEYAGAFGELVTEAESHTLRHRAFLAAHTRDWISIAAFGDGAVAWVPKGNVGVVATLGGCRATTVPRRRFLVPASEYEELCSPFGFAIDPARHPEVPGDPVGDGRRSHRTG